MVNTALSKLVPSECENAGDKKLISSLKSAYALAAEQHDLDYYKQLLREHEASIKQQIEEEAKLEEEAQAKEAAKAEKAATKEKKTKRKSKGAEDDMEVDEDAAAAPKSSKKRKKDAESEGEGPKVNKAVQS